MESRKVALGGLMLFLSSLILIETQAVSFQTPLYITAAASLAIAVGSVLAGSHRHDRPA